MTLCLTIMDQHNRASSWRCALRSWTNTTGRVHDAVPYDHEPTQRTNFVTLSYDHTPTRRANCMRLYLTITDQHGGPNSWHCVLRSWTNTADQFRHTVLRSCTNSAGQLHDIVSHDHEAIQGASFTRLWLIIMNQHRVNYTALFVTSIHQPSRPIETSVSLMILHEHDRLISWQYFTIMQQHSCPVSWHTWRSVSWSCIITSITFYDTVSYNRVSKGWVRLISWQYFTIMHQHSGPVSWHTWRSVKQYCIRITDRLHDAVSCDRVSRHRDSLISWQYFTITHQHSGPVSWHTWRSASRSCIIISDTFLDTVSSDRVSKQRVSFMTLWRRSCVDYRENK